MSQPVLPRSVAKYLGSLPPAVHEKLTPLVTAVQEALSREGVEADDLAAILAGQPLASPEEEVALLEALARMPHPLLPAVLQAHFGGRGDKARQKALKKALHQLKAQGVAVPAAYFKDQAPSIVAPVAAATSVTAYISRVEGNGSRMVALHLPGLGQPFNLLVFLANDVEGLKDGYAISVGKKEVKRYLEGVRGEIPGTLAEVDPAYALGVLETCFQAAPENSSEGAELYRRFRGLLQERVGKAPIVDPQELLPVLDDPKKYLELAPTLLLQEDFANWMPTPEEVKPLLEKLQALSASPLHLTDAQYKSRYNDIVNETIQQFFPPQQRQLLSQRLLHMAYYLEKADNPFQAEMAQAVAQDLARERSFLEEESAFLTAMLMFPMQELFEEVPEAKQQTSESGRIITDLSGRV
jgi:hypothetical protein